MSRLDVLDDILELLIKKALREDKKDNENDKKETTDSMMPDVVKV